MKRLTAAEFSLLLLAAALLVGGCVTLISPPKKVYHTSLPTGSGVDTGFESTPPAEPASRVKVRLSGIAAILAGLGLGVLALYPARNENKES